MRHRIWVPALACVVFLLAFICATLYFQSLAIDLSSNSEYLAQRAAAQFLNILGYKNILLSIVAITGALICGLQGFFYLFNRSQLDFYHSLPIQRDQLFLIRWFNGLLFYLIPSLMFTVLSTIVSAAFGLLHTEYLSVIAIGFLHQLLIFLLVYHSTILACMFSGNLLVTIGILGTFSVYTYVIVMLVPTFLRVYYTTYTQYHIGLAHYLKYLSPGWVILHLCTEPKTGNYVFTVVFMALLWLLALAFYRLRASEAAGKALAFPVLGPIFRVLATIPVALYAGLAFGQIAPGWESLWSIVGLLVFLFLTHGILEVIFSFDIHAIFHHKKELAACAVFSLIFMSVFLTDVLKLDEQIPSENAVNAVYVDLPVDTDMYYLDPITGKYIYTDDYRLEHAMFTGNDLDTVYALLALRENGKESTTEEEAMEMDGSSDSYLTLPVRFVKTNGQSEYRAFRIRLSKAEDAMAAVFNTNAYKQGHYQIFDAACDTAMTDLTVYDAANTEMVRSTTGTSGFSNKETQEFIQALRQDLTNFTYEEMMQDIPVAEVAITNEQSSMYYYLYPSFTESLSWLADKGIDLNAWTTRTPVSMMIGTDDDYDIMDEAGYYVNDVTLDQDGQEFTFPSPQVVTDPEVIASFYPYLYRVDFIDRTTLTRLHHANDIYQLVYVTVTWQDADGEEISATYYLSTDFDLKSFLDQ